MHSSLVATKGLTASHARRLPRLLDCYCRFRREDSSQLRARTSQQPMSMLGPGRAGSQDPSEANWKQNGNEAPICWNWDSLSH
jgi:hypothetical protein